MKPSTVVAKSTPTPKPKQPSSISSNNNNNLKDSLLGNGKSFNNQRPVNLLKFFEEKKYPTFRYDQLVYLKLQD
jgi:hypothetical protein